MTNESRIREILKRIDALHQDVEALLPKVEIPRPERSPAMCIHAATHGVPAHGRPVNVPSCPAIRVPSAAVKFFQRVADWFWVRGDFAPDGMSREFSVATRWLLRAGALLLVGTMSYFLMLAINRGWIGPMQRVFGMIFWGLAGIAGGTWVKVRKERYAIIGEVFVAIGLVALYLSFGLGHRYFNPPVIPSKALAFVGLMLATVMAGWLSVRFKSLMIATLSLVGGFIVPILVRFNVSVVSLDVYLVVVTLGATAMASLRSWTVLAFAALGIANIMVLSAGHECWPIVKGAAYSAFFAQALFLTLHGVKRRLAGQNAFCWAFVCLMAFAIVSAESYWLGKLHFPVLASGLMTIVWSLIAFGLLVLGVMRCLAQFRLCGLALLAVSAVKALLFDTASLATPARVAVFACVGALLIIGAFLYLRFRSRFEVFAK